MPDLSALVIDDNPDNAILVRILLECDGITVRTAEHALQALEILKDWRPTVILMDIQLPGMDGLELTRHLRRDPVFQDLPIIALTAYAMKKDEEDALEAGCDGYIAKPIDTRTFCGLLRKFLATRTELDRAPLQESAGQETQPGLGR